MYDILGDKHLLKSASSILVVCNKQGEQNTAPVLYVTLHPLFSFRVETLFKTCGIHFSFFFFSDLTMAKSQSVIKSQLEKEMYEVFSV